MLKPHTVWEHTPNALVFDQMVKGLVFPFGFFAKIELLA